MDQRDTIHALVELGADASAAWRFMKENPVSNDYEPWAEEDFIRKSAANPPRTGVVSFKDEGGNTHLHWAAALGEPALIKRLLESDFDVTMRSEGPGKLALKYDAGATPLHLAAAFGHPDAVDVLLAAGAKATATDTKGRMPKDVVCKHSSQRYYHDYSASYSNPRCLRITASLSAAAGAPR